MVLCEIRTGLRMVTTEQHESVFKTMSADLQGIGEIGQVDFVMVLEVGKQVLSCLFQSRGSVCGE